MRIVQVIAIVATVGGLIFCCCLGYNVVMCCGYDDEDDDDDDYKKPGESEEDFEFRRAASAFKRAPPKAAATTKSKSRRQSLRLGWRRISSIVIGGKTESLKAITQKTVQNSRMLTFVSSGKFSSVQQTGLAGARDVKNQQGISPVKPWAVQQQGSANKVESSTRSLGNKSFKQPEHTVSCAVFVFAPTECACLTSHMVLPSSACSMWAWFAITGPDMVCADDRPLLSHPLPI